MSSEEENEILPQKNPYSGLEDYMREKNESPKKENFHAVSGRKYPVRGIEKDVLSDLFRPFGPGEWELFCNTQLEK